MDHEAMLMQIDALKEALRNAEHRAIRSGALVVRIEELIDCDSEKEDLAMVVDTAFVQRDMLRELVKKMLGYGGLHGERCGAPGDPCSCGYGAVLAEAKEWFRG
jgi:hypothetical protein